MTIVFPCNNSSCPGKEINEIHYAEGSDILQIERIKSRNKQKVRKQK